MNTDTTGFSTMKHLETCFAGNLSFGKDDLCTQYGFIIPFTKITRSSRGGEVFYT